MVSEPLYGLSLAAYTGYTEYTSCEYEYKYEYITLK